MWGGGLLVISKDYFSKDGYLVYRAHGNFYLVLGNIWQHEWAEYCAEVDCCPDVFFWFFLFLIWLFVSTRSQENKQPLPVFHDRAWEGQKKRVQICKWKQINDTYRYWWLQKIFYHRHSFYVSSMLLFSNWILISSML